MLIDRTRRFVRKLPSASFQNLENRPVTTKAGFAERRFSSWEYLHLYTIPNFLFHYSMAYAILRVNGVAVGKRDFDGFHEYPPGFTLPGQ